MPKTCQNYFTPTVLLFHHPCHFLLIHYNDAVCLKSTVFFNLQLTGDALRLYGIDVKKITKLADVTVKLEPVAVKKCKKENSEAVKEMVSQHYRRMDETLCENVRRG